VLFEICYNVEWFIIRKEYLIRPIEDFFGIRKDYSLSSADKARVLSEAQKLKAKKKK
jgi:hypothetical protein